MISNLRGLLFGEPAAKAPIRIHVAIIGWTGFEEKAKHIAAAVEDEADFVTVVYSNRSGTPCNGAGEWIQVPDDWYYGRKFREALRANRGDVQLQIQADAEFDDWPLLVSRCREAFRDIPNLGVWCPDLDHTPWLTSAVQIARLGDTPLVCATQTDGIVWALGRPIIDRLQLLDYEANNLGWGIDWAALAHAYTNNYLVLRDLSLRVHHPAGSGYNRGEASRQMEAFMQQLSIQELAMYQLLHQWIVSNRQRTQQVSARQ